MANKLVTDSICKIYPGDPNICNKDLPSTQISIAGSIIIIIVGIIFLARSHLFIIKLADILINVIKSILTKLSTLIGFLLIIGGIISLNKSMNV